MFLLGLGSNLRTTEDSESHIRLSGSAWSSGFHAPGTEFVTLLSGVFRSAREGRRSMTDSFSRFFVLVCLVPSATVAGAQGAPVDISESVGNPYVLVLLGLGLVAALSGAMAVAFYRKAARHRKEADALALALERSSRALEASEEDFRVFFQDDLTSRFVLDEDGKVQKWNPSFEAFLGLDPDQIGNANATALLEGFSFDEIRDSGPGPTGQWEVQVDVKGLGQHVGLLSVTRIERNDDTEFHGSIVDLTQRRELETQLFRTQKMETVGRLAGGVAHDVNNMLGVILGNADLIQAEGPFPGTIDEDLDEIRQAALRSSRLTRQLLTMARRDVANPAVLDLNKVVRDMAPLFRRVIGADIELVTLLHDEIPSIRIDLAQMEQVLLNLLVNAAESMPDGGKAIIEVTRIGGEDGKPDQACICVADNGIGMDEGTLSRVFDPFFSTKEGGTGLGLSTVYGVVTRAGGTVSASSALGEGSTFELCFPAARTEPTGEAEKAPWAPAEA